MTSCEPVDHCVDGDHDGFFDIDQFCDKMPFDCDDTNPDIYPGAVENCDLQSGDENCDGIKNCEVAACRTAMPEACEEDCDQDKDGYKATRCGGNDCKDIIALESNAAQVYPGHDLENTDELCHDGVSNDCDSNIDCADEDCIAFCPAITPTPTPTPGDGGGGDGGGGDGGGGGCDCGDCIYGCDGGGGGDCHIEVIPNNDCCPWNPYTYTCYACQDFEIIVCN